MKEMTCKLDLTKEYGIVLEGGGAKGAYQIGVWRALEEAGVKIRGISGTSVGALNGALMCMNDRKRAEEIWGNMSYDRVMDVDEEFMEMLLNPSLKNLNIADFFKEAAKIVSDRGMDVTPLRDLIGRCCDEERIRNSDRDLYVSTICVTDMALLNVNVKETEPGQIADMLLASAYFPAFKQEKLHGKTYMDGGAWNNVPIDSLLEAGYEDIIVVRIFGPGIERDVEIPEQVRVHTVAPKQELGKVLEFDGERSRYNMELGYYDGLRFLYGLEGQRYYIRPEEQEPEAYFRTLLEMAKPVTELLMSAYAKESQLGLEASRGLCEVVFPKIAKELELDENWTYRKLYYRLLDLAAEAAELPNFCVYEEAELRKTLKNQAFSANVPEKSLPAYLTVIFQYSNLNI